MSTATDSIYSLLQSRQLSWIGLAVASVVGYGLYEMNRPPAHLRHIPVIDFWTLCKTFFNRRPQSERCTKIILPKVMEAHSIGYMAKFPLSWTLFITDPVMAKTVLMKTDVFEKNLDLLHALDDRHPLVNFFGRDNVVFANGETWKNQRKVLNPPFRRALPVEIFGKLMDKVFARIDRSDGKVVAIDVMQRLTLDALGQGLFGFDFHALDEDNSVWVETYDVVRDSFRSPVTFLLARFDWIVQRLSSSRQRAYEASSKLNNLLYSMAQEKRKDVLEQKNNQNKDLLTYMIESNMSAENDTEAMQPSQFKSNLAVFFLAGHDTTANTLSFCFYNLALHKDIQEKARQEAIQILGEGDHIPTAEDCKQMKYIDMIIKENLRLYGPVSQLRARVALKDIQIGDTFIRKGTMVSIDIGAIHFHPDLWHEPERFDPERFADDNEHSHHKGLAWIPFSNGGRQCLGMNFSLMEQRVAISMLLRKYYVDLPSDSIHKDGVQIGHFQNQAPKSLTIQFTPRHVN